MYLVCASRWHHKLFAYFKTVNIWRTRQVIEKLLKTLCRYILIRCSTEIKTRQRIFHETAPLTISSFHLQFCGLREGMDCPSQDQAAQSPRDFSGRLERGSTTQRMMGLKITTLIFTILLVTSLKTGSRGSSAWRQKMLD